MIYLLLVFIGYVLMSAMSARKDDYTVWNMFFVVPLIIMSVIDIAKG